MFFALLAQVLTFLLDLLALPWRSSREKDLEILLLRQQLAILQRTPYGAKIGDQAAAR